jgi:hypothetical protein
LLWWELQRVGDVLGAGVVGGEFEAGRVYFFAGVAGYGCFGGNCGAGIGMGSGSGVGLVLAGADGE